MKILLSVILIVGLSGCGYDSCCGVETTERITEEVSETKLQISTSELQVENIDVELFCSCNGKTYDAGYVEKTTYEDGTTSYRTHFNKDIDALLSRHTDLTPLYRAKGSLDDFVEITSL
jgi:hypothetical protein